ALTTKFVRRAQARDVGKGKLQFARWAQARWKDKPGALHRNVRGPISEVPEIHGSADPTFTMATQADYWRQVWQDPVDTVSDILAALRRDRQCAQDQDAPPLTLHDLDEVLARASARKATGIDNFTVDDLARLKAHWDTAPAGPSALRASIRLLVDEAAIANDKH
ncbi:unnamed protein product, partial [Prorocentrum cordatum]